MIKTILSTIDENTDAMQEKSLGQLLEEYAHGPEADRRTRNRAAFREHRDEILAALGAGWSMRKIWDVLRRDGRINFSYSVFAHFVRKCRDGESAPGIGTGRGDDKENAGRGATA